MQQGEVYYKFCVYEDKPFLKTFTVEGPSLNTPNAFQYKENYSVVGQLKLLRTRERNHVYFENEIGAATNIYEQHKLRTQQGVKSQMISKIVEWDYFQQLLEDYPSIMV